MEPSWQHQLIGLVNQNHHVSQVEVARLPFRVVPAGDKSKQKLNEIFKDLPNVPCPTDDILTLGYDADGRHHVRSLRGVIEICCLENMKRNAISIVAYSQTH